MQGGVVYYTKTILKLLGLESTVERLVSAETLQVCLYFRNAHLRIQYKCSVSKVLDETE